VKCIYCQERAGLFKRICLECSTLVTFCRALPDSFGYREFLDRLLATGADPTRIEKFLHADPDGSGSINDQITARMTNQIMGSLGQPSHMTSTDVKKVRDDIAAGKAPSKVDSEITDYHPLKKI